MAGRPGKPVSADERSVPSGLGTCISGRPRRGRLRHSTVTLLARCGKGLVATAGPEGLNFAARSERRPNREPWCAYGAVANPG